MFHLLGKATKAKGNKREQCILGNCDNCGKQGHKAVDCWQPPKAKEVIRSKVQGKKHKRVKARKVQKDQREAKEAKAKERPKVERAKERQKA